MNSLIENRLSMYRTVIKACDKSASVLQNVSGLWTDYQLFRSAVTELDEMLQLQMQDFSGAALGKSGARERLIEKLYVIAGMVCSYAVQIDDNILYSSVNYSPSSLRYSRDEETLEAALLVRKLAEVHSSHLAPMGFTTALWNDFLAALSDYESRVEDPADARKARKVYTTAINDIDRRIREILSRRLDKSIRVIGLTEPLVLARYVSARNIYDNRSGKKKKSGDIPAMLSGFVNDDQGLPVIDALVNVEGTQISVFTDADGEYLIDNLAAGTYNIVVSAEGYTEARENNIVFIAGDDIARDFILEAIAPPSS